MSQYGRINTNVDFFANANTIGAQYLKGDGSNISNIAGANVSGEVTFAATANAIAGANVSGEVANANYAAYAGNVTIAAQANITSVGVLTSLAVSGDITTSGGASPAPSLSGFSTLSAENLTLTKISTLGNVGNVKITGGTLGQVLVTDGTGNLSWTTASSGGYKYTREFHVDPVNGNDTTGTGAYDKPYLTIMKAHSVITTGQALVLHIGTYAENVTWTKTNTDIVGLSKGGAVLCTGTWTVGTATPASVRIADIAFSGTFTQNSTGRLFFRRCQVTGAFTKTSGEYLQADDTDFEAGISINSAGSVVIKGGQTNGLTVNNASAIVNVGGLISGAVFTNTAGTLLVNDSIVYSATPTTAAITSSVGTATYLYNTTTATTSGTQARLTLAGFWSMADVRYDSANSTVTGTNLNSISHFDAVNTQGLANVGSLQVRGTSTLGPVGNVSITGGTTGQVLTTNGSGVLSWATAASSASYYEMKTNVIAHEVQYRDYDTSLGGSSPLVTVTTRADASALKFGDVLQMLAYNGIANKPTGAYYEFVWARNTMTGAYDWTQNVTLNSDNGISIDNYKTPLYSRSTSSDISFNFATQAFPVSSAKTFTTSNLPLSGSVGSTTLILTVTNSATITWPTGTKWPEGTPPTLGDGTHVVSLMTYDGGVTFLGAALTSYS